MSASKAQAQPERVDNHALREMQKAIAVARCIELAADRAEGQQLDLADALAGLVVILNSATAALDQPEVRS